MKSYRSHCVYPVVVVFALLAFTSALNAGTSGKIAGMIVNSETGEPLAGATVSIEQLGITSVTDPDGEFYLINIPVGTYTLLARSLGYEALAKLEVKVMLDLTTPVDFELAPAPIATDKVVTVKADRPQIQRDRTSSVNIVTRDEMRYLPNALSIQDVIDITAGTVRDADGNLHVRGGRDGTNSYYFDGIPVQDPFFGDAATRIAPDALEEIDIVPGGFSAEYGEALSGVVSAITQEGTNEYHGKLKFYDGLTRDFNPESSSFEDMERLGRNSFVGNLGGPIPYFFDKFRATFFTSSEYRQIDGYLPHNDLNSYSQVGKVTLKPIPSMKLNILGNFYRARVYRYVHRDVNGYSYDFNLDGLGMYKTESSRLGFWWTYNPRENVVLNARLNHFESWTKLAPEHLFDKYWTEWPGYSEDDQGNYNGDIHTNNYNASSDYFYTGFTSGDDFYPVYAYWGNGYKSFAADVLTQMNKSNQVKFGVEYRVNKLQWDNKQFFNNVPYGEKYFVRPKYAAAYLQDKLELREMVLNGGIRVDYLDASVGYWDNPVTKNEWKTAESKTQWSPRFGISHPIADNTVIHFNYGLFFQVPLYSYMYTNLLGELNSGFPLVGNPDLEPEKTVQYELGLSHAINNNTVVKAVTYYKDISNLTTTRKVVYAGGSYVEYVNADYGSVKGVDLILSRKRVNNLAATLNYSYMIARGNASYATEGYYDYFTQEDPPEFPVREYPLAFDQRHTLSFNLDYRIPRDYNVELFGVGLPSAWGANMLFKYGSGMPYTKTDNEGNRIGLPNEGRMPSNYTFDLKVNKDFYLNSAGDMFLSMFIEIENLFDKRNVINVYSNTGEPDDDGTDFASTPDPDGDGPLTAEDVNEAYRLLAADPQNYDQPRQIRWGLELIF